MNVSQEIRNTLAKSGDRMSVDEITDAIGALADRTFVQAICSQHAKRGAFGREMEQGRMVYWMIDATKAANESSDELSAQASVAQDRATAATHETPAPRAARQSKLERAKPNPQAASEPAKDPMHPFIPDAPGKELAATTTQLNDLVQEVQSERILRMERTSHNLQRLLSALLGDAIDAQLEHEVLRRLSTAQLAVQDVHGYLVNVG